MARRAARMSASARGRVTGVEGHRGDGGAVARLDEAGEVAGGEQARRGGRDSSMGARPVRVTGWMRATGAPARPGRRGRRIGSIRPSSSAKVKQSSEGMSSQRVGGGLGRGLRGCRRGIRRLWTPRRAMATVAAAGGAAAAELGGDEDLAEVLGGGVEHADRVDLEHLDREGRGEGLDGGETAGLLRLVGQDVGGAEREEVEGPAAGVEVEDEVGASAAGRGSRSRRSSR